MLDTNSHVVVGLIGLLTPCVGKILWDWLKSGRLEKGEYLTIAAFEKHKENCCAISLKKEFSECRQNSGANQAKTETRLLTIEGRLEDGREDFRAIRKDISRMADMLTRLQTSIEFMLERKQREDN